MLAGWNEKEELKPLVNMFAMGESKNQYIRYGCLLLFVELHVSLSVFNY